MPSKTARKKGWKDAQTKRQNTQKTKLAIMVLGLIFTLLLLAQAVKFTQLLFNPWKDPKAIKRTVFWNGEFNINILLKSKGLSLVSYSPQNKNITIVDIPNTTYLEAAHGFGKWQVGSIYGLGGSNLLKDSLVNFFAVPIEGLLDFSDKYSQIESEELVSEIRKDPFSVINILPFLKTDLTPFELVRLKMGLSSVRFDKIKHLNLEKSDSLEKERLADGTEVEVADTIKLDSALGLKDPIIQSEHKNVAVFNSTSHPGLAQKAARIIANLGADVIITSNGETQLKTTLVLGEKSKTLDKLKQVFKASDIIDKSNKDLVSSRAQINVFLGEDFFNSL